MAHYAGARGGVPFHKREEQRRWQDHLKKHKKLLARSKPTIPKSEETEKYNHIHLKLKALQLQEDRLSNIEYENRILLDRINRVAKRTDKQSQNDLYIRLKNTPRTPRTERESPFEDTLSSSGIDEDEELNLDSEREDGSTTEARPETSSDIMNSVRSKEKRDVDEEKKRIKSSIQGQESEPEEEEESLDDTQLQKRLQHMLRMDPNTRLAGESEDQRMERQKIIEEAREVIRKENEVQKDRDEPRAYSRKTFDERVMENMRLHRKIKEIKKGRGKPSSTDPSYNSHDRWWITSPRGKDKVAYEEEKRKLIEEAKKRKIQKKQQRAKEEKKILKLKEKEQESKRNEIPDGYRKRKRKKSKVAKEVTPEDAKEAK